MTDAVTDEANGVKDEDEAVDPAILQAEHDQWLHSPMFGARTFIPNRWLRNKRNPAEYGPIPITFEEGHTVMFYEEEWAEIFSILQEGDEVWNYSYHPHPKMGEAGLALVRGGEVIRAWQTVHF